MAGSINRFRIVTPWVMLGAWVVSFLTGLFIRSYTPPPELNAIMLLIVSATFGFGGRRYIE